MRRSSYCQVYLEQFSDFHRNADNEQFQRSRRKRIGSQTSGSLPDARILSYVVRAFCSAAISSCRSVIGSPFGLECCSTQGVPLEPEARVRVCGLHIIFVEAGFFQFVLV